MNDTDMDLDARIVALEARAPGRDDPPALTSSRRRGRFAVSMAMAPVLVFALVATAAAGAIVARNFAQQHEGLENPGQPLAGANLECMTPPQAAAYLAAHGYPNVVWQVEIGKLSTKVGNKGGTTGVSQVTAPEHGFVIPGFIDTDGTVQMIADQRVGSTGSGACFGQPMP